MKPHNSNNEGNMSVGCIFNQTAGSTWHPMAKVTNLSLFQNICFVFTSLQDTGPRQFKYGHVMSTLNMDNYSIKCVDSFVNKIIYI